MKAPGWLWPKTLRGKLAVATAVATTMLVALWAVAYVLMEQRVAAAWRFGEQFGLPSDPVALFGPPLAESENALNPFQTAIARAMQQCNLVTASKPGTNAFDPDALVAPNDLLNDPDYEAALAEADRRQRFRSHADPAGSLANLTPKYVPDLRGLTVSEVAITRWLAARGRKEEGVRRLVRYARLLRRWSGCEPTVWPTLFASGAQVTVLTELNAHLRRPGPLPAELHDALDAELARQEDVGPAFRRAFQGEKWRLAEHYDALAPVRGTLLRPYNDLDKLLMLNCFNEAMTLTTLPPAEAKLAETRLFSRYTLSSRDPFDRVLYPISSTGLPNLSLFYLQPRRVTALVRCLRVVNAMARRNNFAAPLESLGLLAEYLVDPYDGEQLRVVHREDGGVVIYSVGHNGKDDHGLIDPPNQLFDVGLGPAKPLVIP